jgi:UDP-N-acetylmuramoyl-tripeptide--D-alanyl-D-alanine ligase
MLECAAAEVARMSGGVLAAGDGDVAVAGVTTDSRKVFGRELFVALDGERFDGHDFVWKAFASGCSAAMVSRALRGGQLPANAALIEVPDGYAGLGRLAAAHRRSFEMPWVAVTGSCGKSTTKELIAATLGGGKDILKAEASFNNRVGVPLTLLGAGPEHRYAVVELGSNHRGELAPLAAMTSPDVAVITCVAPAHLSGFGDLQGVADEKGAILESLGTDGIAVLNADDDFFETFKSQAPGRIVSFGLSAEAEVRGSGVALNPDGTEFDLPDGSHVKLPLPGVHNVLNALAAVATVSVLGVSFPQAAERLGRTAPLHMRSRLLRLGGLLLLEDCYNANPASFLAALQALDNLGDHRKVVVAGDMAELGSHSERHHRALGTEIAGRGIELVVAVGPESRLVSEAASQSSARVESRHYMDAASAAAALPEMLREGDAVLVKGSRSMGLEVVVDALVAAFDRGEGA